MSKKEEFFKEAIVTAIGEYAAGMIDEQGKGLGQKLFELITSLAKVLSGLPQLAAANPKALKDIAEGTADIVQQIKNKEFLNMDVMTADPNFKLPDLPKIPEIPEMPEVKLPDIPKPDISNIDVDMEQLETLEKIKHL